MWPVLGGFLSGGASLLGGLMNNSNQQSMNNQNNEWNAMLQIQNQQYQTQMSNTAYQRGVADMKAAGLNPMMMFGGSGGPASSPSGGTVAGTPAQVHDPISPAVDAALSAIDKLATVDQKNVQNENIAAGTAKQVAEKQKTQAETANTLKEGGWINPKRKAEVANLGAQSRELGGRTTTYAPSNALTVQKTIGQSIENQISRDFGHDDIRKPSTWKPAIQGIGEALGGMFHQTAKGVDDYGPRVKRIIDVSRSGKDAYPSALPPPTKADRIREWDRRP